MRSQTPEGRTVIRTGQISGAKEPQVAVGARGRVYVAFGAGDTVYTSVSGDAGRTFGAPVRVGGAGSLSLGMRRGPRVVATGNGAVVTAIGGKNGGGADGDLLCWRSVDNGKTWRGSGRVSDVSGSAREGLHAMAIAPGGRIACAWLDLRESGTQIFAAFSADGGATWGKNVRVYRSPDRTVCECCHPSLAFDARGTLYVMWRNWVGGARDMYVCRTRDDGKTFSPAYKLGAGTWPLNACPMDGGAIVAASNGAVTTIWRRENTMYLAGGNGAGAVEQELGRGQQGWIAANAAGVYAVWLRGRPGTLLARVPGAGQPIVLAERADDPVVGAGSEPGGAVIVVWSDAQGIRAANLA